MIAFDCGHGWMHVNADWYVLEPVDEDYRPTPAGRPSRGVLLTNLANRAQPVIRYGLGDSVTVKQDPCPCGRTLPAIRVEGRTDDTLAFEAEDGGTVRLLPLALGSVVEETPGVRRFQAVKDGPRSLKVRLETEKGADEGAVWRSVETRTRRYLAAQGAATVSVGRDPAPPAPDPRSGKFRQVWAVS